jgi:hypothetical protein
MPPVPWPNDDHTSLIRRSVERFDVPAAIESQVGSGIGLVVDGFAFEEILPL